MAPTLPCQRSPNICRCLTDCLIVFVAGFPCVILLLVARPYEQGFYCDDQSLMHPYLNETVPVVFVAIFVAVAPISIVYFIECWQKDRRCGISRGIFYKCRKFLMPFFFGCCVTQLVTDIAKYSVGRLRPHFLTVCQPMIENCSLETGFIYGDGVCYGRDTSAITEARLSFPSGHSSMSFYCVIWLTIYLQTRFTWLRYWLVRPILQLVLFIVAFYVALSRISDYFHHWSDVLAGAVLGVISAFTAFYIFTDYENPNSANGGDTLPRHVIVREDLDPSEVTIERTM